jgi:hypothetical protein
MPVDVYVAILPSTRGEKAEENFEKDTYRLLMQAITEKRKQPVHKPGPDKNEEFSVTRANKKGRQASMQMQGPEMQLPLSQNGNP